MEIKSDEMDTPVDIARRCKQQVGAPPLALVVAGDYLRSSTAQTDWVESARVRARVCCISVGCL